MKVQLDMSVDAVSESAPRKAKLPGYIAPMINRVRTLIIPSSSKPAVQEAVNATKEIKTLVKSAAKEYEAAAKLRKESAAEEKKKVPDFKKSHKLDKEAAAHEKAGVKIRKSIDKARKAGTAALKKAGLSHLYIPVAAEHITGIQRTPAKVLKTVQAIKANTFAISFVKKRISYMTPKFTPDARFETMAQSIADKAAGKKPASKKPAAKPAVKTRAGAITGASSPEKQRAKKAQDRGDAPSVVKALLNGEKLTAAQRKEMNEAFAKKSKK